MSQNPLVKSLVFLFNSFANLGFSPTSSLIQRMRTKGINVYSIICLVFGTMYWISEYSRASVFDYWYIGFSMAVYAMCLVLNASRNYKYANLLFNVCTPFLTLLSVVFYGLGVEVTSYPTAILFAIICYPRSNDRNILISYNLLCIGLGLLYHYFYTPVFLSTVNFIDDVFLLMLNTTIISAFFIAVMIEFRRSRDHKEILISTLVVKQAESMEASKDILQFTRVMSHDLKNQLQSIQGFQHLLNEEDELLEHQNTQKHLTVANAKVDSIKRTLAELSTFNRLVESEGSTETLDLNSLIRDLNLTSGNQEVNIKTHLEGVRASKQKVELILRTILEHGLLYNSSDRPSVNVTSKEHADNVEVIFVDNGKGLSELSIRSIFLPYRKTGTFENSDWHLRFSMISSLINNLGWKIDLTSELGKGSKFSLLIPKSDLVSEPQLNSN